MATMTSLQIQSFASLIDQLPIGVEESERIDRAANAACSSGSEDGSAERARELAEGKTPVPPSDCSKSTCHDSRQPNGPVACPRGEALSSDHVYGGSGGFSGMPFPPAREDATCMRMLEQSGGPLAAGACAVENSIVDGSFIPVTSPSSRSAVAHQHSAAGLRGFPPLETCTSVEPMQGFLTYCPEEASAGFASTMAPQEYNNPDMAASSAQSGGRGGFSMGPGCMNSSWPSWGQGCAAAPECKYGAHTNRSCCERLSGQLPQNFRGPQASQAASGMYGGGQVQVSIVSPGEDVVVTSYGCSDWPGCCNGCQVEVTRVSRPTSPRHLSPARARQTVSPASIKVKSVSPSGPDQFVLCLEGESGQEQHVSIDRQELLLAASGQMQASPDPERAAKVPAGNRHGNTLMAKNGLHNIGTVDHEDGAQMPRFGGDSFIGAAGDSRCEGWNQEVRKWQSQFCRELELQKKRLQQREEACRKREEEFRQREDEARRQKMTIAALEGEVLKVTEEMQEILLQKEEGRLIVQREFLERKSRYVSRLQDLRPFLGVHFEDVLRGLTSCRTIGQLSTWSSIFDATEDMAPKMAAQHIIEVLKSGITAPLFVSAPSAPGGSNVFGVALDFLSRPSPGGSSLRYTARGPLTDQCILRIPSLTNDSYVRVDDNSEIIPDNACTSRVCSVDGPRFHHVHVGEAIVSRCRHQHLGQGPAEDPQGRDNARGLRASALWGGGIDSVSLSLGSPMLEPAGMKDITSGAPQHSVQAGQLVLPSSASTELTMDGIYLRPICSRLPSRTTSICGDHDSTHADWAPCRIDSRHAEEALDAQGGDGCGSWMERVAYANGGGSLSISFFNAASRTHRAPSPICG